MAVRRSLHSVKIVYQVELVQFKSRIRFKVMMRLKELVDTISLIFYLSVKLSEVHQLIEYLVFCKYSK